MDSSVQTQSKNSSALLIKHEKSQKFYSGMVRDINYGILELCGIYTYLNICVCVYIKF